MNAWNRVVLLSVSVLFASTPRLAPADAVQAQEAYAFCDSIGVAVHLNYSPETTNWSTIEPLLTGLGVHHIRDGFLPNPYAGELVQMQQANGIKATVCTSPVTSQGILDPTQIATNLVYLQTNTFSQYGGSNMLSAVEAVEGPNEWDVNHPSGDQNWVAELTTYQQALYNEIKTNATYSNLVVVGPSMAIVQDQASLPNMTSMVQTGNDHPYPGTGDIGYSGIDDYLTDSQTSWPSTPLQITEDGYETNPNTDSDAVTEAYQGNMEPHICLENFRRGVQRTFLYDLVDEGTSSDTNGSHHFGLVENDGTTFPVKPAYNSIKNMLSVLYDGTNTFTPGALSFNLSGTTADVHTLLLEKKAGSYYLVLWVESTNQSASEPVTVTFDDTMQTSATTYNPCVSTTGTAVTLTNNACNLTLTTQPTILKVTPAYANGSLLIDDLANMSETTSVLNWTNVATPAANWIGRTTAAQRTVATGTNNLVYGSVDIRGVTALIGFGWNTTNPDGVAYAFSKVQLYASPDNTNWTSVPTYVGEIDKSAAFLAQASARWLVPVSAAGALPAGSNFVKFQINSTDGVTLPQLFQMNVRQSGVEEAENMPQTDSGATSTTVSDPNASNGEYVQLNATGSGQYMQFTTPILPAGTYEYYVRFVKEPNNGEVQVSIDGTNYSGVFSQAGTAGSYDETGRATVTFASTGTHTLKFLVTGTLSSGYTINCDRVVFSQTSP